MRGWCALRDRRLESFEGRCRRKKGHKECTVEAADLFPTYLTSCLLGFWGGMAWRDAWLYRRSEVSSPPVLFQRSLSDLRSLPIVRAVIRILAAFQTWP